MCEDYSKEIIQQTKNTKIHKCIKTTVLNYGLIYVTCLFLMHCTLKIYSTSNLSGSGSLVQPLHVPLLTDIQGSIHKHLKERQPCSLVDLPGIEAILADYRQTNNETHTRFGLGMSFSYVVISLCQLRMLFFFRNSLPCCREK